MQQTLDALRLERGARGAIAVIDRDGQTWRIHSGTADEAATPVSTAMRFRIGSITKPIIAALALGQVEDGTLALDQNVSDLVGPPLRSSPPVSLRNLLDHTSGIFDIGNEGDVMADLEGLTDPELIEEARTLIAGATSGRQVVASDRLAIGLAETHDRYFSPGAGYHYSNANYQMIGLVLSSATGQELDDLLRMGLTEPLSLTRTSLAPFDRTTPAFHGYAIDVLIGEEVDATDDLLAFGNGASGGIISTADEVMTVMTEIVHGSLLPPELRTEMQTPTEQSGGTYGLGLALYELSCGRFYGHEGRVNGTASIALVEGDRRDRSLVAAFNSTSDRGGLVEVAEQLLCGSHVSTPAPTHPSGG